MMGKVKGHLLLLLPAVLLALAMGLLPQPYLSSAHALAQHNYHHGYKLLAVADDTQPAHHSSKLLLAAFK